MSTFAASAVLYSGKLPASRRSRTTTAAVIHQLNDPLTSICFILRVGSKPCADSRGDEHLFQIFERGEQYGIMLGGLGESIPVRIFALEPSTILSLDHEKSMELMLLHPDAGSGYRPTPAACGGGFSSPPPRGRRLRCSTNPRRRATSLRRSSGACKDWGKRSPFSATRSPGGRYPMWGSVRCWTATDSSRWQRFADRLLSGTRPNASSSMSLLLRTWTGPCS